MPDERLTVQVPASWLDAAVLAHLPYALWLLLAADTVEEWRAIERTWGAVQRVPMDDGSLTVLVSRIERRPLPNQLREGDTP